MTSTTTDANALFMLYLYDMATVLIKSYQFDGYDAVYQNQTFREAICCGKF